MNLVLSDREVVRVIWLKDASHGLFSCIRQLAPVRVFCLTSASLTRPRSPSRGAIQMTPLLLLLYVVFVYLSLHVGLWCVSIKFKVWKFDSRNNCSLRTLLKYWCYAGLSIDSSLSAAKYSAFISNVWFKEKLLTLCSSLYAPEFFSRLAHRKITQMIVESLPQKGRA